MPSLAALISCLRNRRSRRAPKRAAVGGVLLAMGLLLSAAVPTGASAAPIFNLDLHHNPTHFVPGGGVVPLSASTETEGAAPSTNEVQRFIRGVATSGEFKLSFGAETTADLPHNATDTQVEAALQALPSIGSSDVDVTGVPGEDGKTIVIVTFTGALAATDVPQIAASNGAPRLAIEPEYWIELANVGPDSTAGPMTLTVILPSGITRHSVATTRNGTINYGNWSCPGSAGSSTITCTGSGSIPRHIVDRQIKISVDVDPGLIPGTIKTATARVSGGAAPPAPPIAACPTGVSDCASEPTPIESDPAAFGIVASSFAPGFFAADGITPESQAGAHPDLLTVPFDFNSIDFTTGIPNSYGGPDVKSSAGPVRNIRVNTPPGFLGDPTAVGECPQAALVTSDCPISSQVGRIDLWTAAGLYHAKPVFNMAHPRGAISDLSFVVIGNPVHIRASLDPADSYAITTHVPDINETLPVVDQRLTLWGVPADPSHDSERCDLPSSLFSIETDNECPTDAPRKAFLTVPFECGTDKSWKVHSYDSWLQPGVFGPDITYTMPGQFTGCDQIPFDPAISLAPTTDAADSPSGLDVQIDLPQNDECEQIVPAPPPGETQYDCGIATSPLKDATVTLPEGLTVNPASANGLAACTPAQISLGTDDPVTCPDGSRVASVQVDTVLPNLVEGVVYLATPYDNPFNTLLAGYIVLSDPDLGLLVKIPGRIDVDEDTGQITGTFTDNPQLPFSEFELHFKGGAHSSLITPKTCGDYTSNAEFAPWSGNAAVQPSDTFTIAKGAGGAPCAGSEAELPNSPGFDAGPVSPVSKNFSPFVLHLRREDGSQRFSALNLSLPPGLTGKLAGTELCPDGALAAAESKSGKAEQASPSCPLGSRVGVVEAAAGAGPSPYYAQGTAYLSGPYKGAPVSIATIVPAVAGPFDLGNVVVRAPVFVDPRTAKLSTTTDPFPEMLEGIPLNVRSVSVFIDRPEFTLTGTSCDPASVDGLLTSTLGQSAPLSVRYQLSDCTRLGFKPKMTLRLRGGTKRGKHPALTIALMPRPGDANIASVSVALPRSEFLENAHIRTICTRPDFAAERCPAGAIYGEATVDTPLLDYDLAGHVYLRSSDNLLPDVVPDLRGPAHQPIRLESAGRTDSIKGGIRTTIDFVPDAPFTKALVRLQGASKGLLVNSRDICARAYRATVRYTAHNNLTYVDRPKLRAKCGRRGKRGKGDKGKRRGQGGR